MSNWNQIETGSSGNAETAFSITPPTRTQDAYNRLFAMAHRLGPNAQLPTFTDLRGQIGVSVVTLNKALELLEIHQVLYRRHGVGIFVSPNLGTKQVAVICNPHLFEGPEISPFWQILIDQVKQRVAERRYGFSLYFGTSNAALADLQMDFRRSVEERRIHGVIGVGMGEAATRWLEERKVPVVGFAGQTRFGVYVDYRRIVRESVDHLRSAGCRQIALLTPQGTDERIADFLNLPTSDAGTGVAVSVFRPLEVQEERFYPVPLWEQGYRAAQQLFTVDNESALVSKPDGIVSTSELFSQGVLIALQRHGIAVGEEVKLASHANEGASVLLPWIGEITRFEVSVSELARTMLEMLEILLVGDTPSPAMRVHHARLVVPGNAFQ